MIAWWPGKTRPDTWTNHVGHIVDFLPTMLDLAGADIPDDLPGHSLVPVLKGNDIERPWPVFWQFGRSRAMRDRDWKIIRHGGDNAKWQLYNLAEDPTELNDLASAHPDRLEKMVDQWNQWWASKGSVN